ncbi:hypothetical protein HUJ05_011670 [Dendroctonus ponderosae]|nr:hypothetical protein HUJ05_011670 [Dendroctonus ponderosae]
MGIFREMLYENWLFSFAVREENEKLINSISNSANASKMSVHNHAASTEKLYILNGVT